MKHYFHSLTLLLALISCRCPGQSYQLTDLGALIGTNSYAQGINNQGQVVGYWVTTNRSHAFLYQAGAVTDLGLLGGTNNYALSINNVGQVVGFAETTNGSRAFLYQDGVITNLGSLGGSGSYAFGINGSGQIVGHVDTLNGARAIMYDTGSVINIGTLGGTNSYAFGINNVLQVAGSSLTADNATTHAFLWQSGIINDLNQLQTNTGGWELIDAHGINDFGNIVGWGVISNQEHAFVFSINGATTDLGVLAGGTNSYALGLNNANQIVGASLTLTGSHAVIWQNGVAKDLNNLIDASGWDLKEACGINDLGQIVGWGIVNGQAHAFMLNQTPLQQSSVGAASNATVSPSDSFSPLVNSLTVSITNPVNNATFPSPTNITINATTADSGGTVTQVQFYVGARLLGTDTTSPYSFVWTNAQIGVHALTAVASDNIGQNVTSSVVNVSISTNLLPIADAHVRDGSYTNTNFGTNIVMECLTT
ncbi:MAG: Ig-like domain-containing protein, partial [Verrucomicrobiota bacterium]